MKHINYNLLIENLENDTILISSSSDIKSNENYKKIINEGENILPLLIERIKEKNTMTLCMLISDISGINPINSDGDIEKIKDFYHELPHYETTAAPIFLGELSLWKNIELISIYNKNKTKYIHIINMDFIFLEFYIKKKYNQKVEEYFNINKASISYWRTSNEIPEKRLLQFQLKEGSIEPKELFSKIYS